MEWWVAVLNTLVAVSSAGFGVVAVLKPEATAPRKWASDRFYPAMYAARSIPLGVAVAVGVWALPAGSTLGVLLGVAVVAQLVDVFLGVRCRLPGMATGGAVAAVCHVTAVISLL